MAEPAPIQPEHPAEGISYFLIQGLPVPSFRCSAYQATITVKTCTQRFAQAQASTGQDLDRLIRCRTCPIGAQHSGQAVTHFSPLYESMICPRCRKGTTRMIGDDVCVSCRNRELELAKGRNSKGTKPVKTKSLDRRTVRYAVEGRGRIAEVRTITRERSVDLVEVMASVLRKTRGKVMFAFPGLTPYLRQTRLV